MREFFDAFRNPAVLLGFAGQFLFLGRFVIQWIASERRQQSVIPMGFWYLSVGGALLLLGYAWFRRDPVFLLGQGAAIAIYLRNIVLLKRAPRSETP
jgi:lipid-A-disaccharide synthase-like uncharacterized protein